MVEGILPNETWAQRAEGGDAHRFFFVFRALAVDGAGGRPPEVGMGAAARQAIATPQNIFAVGEVADAARFARSHTHAGEFLPPHTSIHLNRQESIGPYKKE